MDDVHSFSLRKTGKFETDTDKITVSIKYLIEELSVYSVILKDFPATTIYPGKQLNCFAYLRNNKPEYLPPAISDTGFIRLAIHGMQPSKDNTFTITQSPTVNQNNLVVAG